MERNITQKRFSGKIIISDNCIQLVYENGYQYKAENGEKYHTKEYELPPNGIILIEDMTVHQRQLLKIASLCVEQLTNDFNPDNEDSIHPTFF